MGRLQCSPEMSPGPSQECGRRCRPVGTAAENPQRVSCCGGAWPGIGALTNLRELRVSGNRLSGLSAEVGHLRKLHRLVADNNALTSIPGTGPKIPKLYLYALWGTPTSSEVGCPGGQVAL